MAAVLAQKKPEVSEIDDDVLYTGCPKKVLIIIDNKNENNNHTRIEHRGEKFYHVRV